MISQKDFEHATCSEPKDNVNHPQHYISASGMEVIDVIEAFTRDLTGIEAACTANIIKYACRWKAKNGVEDLKKLVWYANHLIERRQGATPAYPEDLEPEKPAQLAWFKSRSEVYAFIARMHQEAAAHEGYVSMEEYYSILEHEYNIPNPYDDDEWNFLYLWDIHDLDRVCVLGDHTPDGSRFSADFPDATLNKDNRYKGVNPCKN